MAALATESESWNVVISHSFSLMMRDLGRVCGFSLLLTLIALLLSFTLSLPVFFLQTAETLRNGIVAGQKPALLNMPLYLMVISQVWHTGINMVLLPIIFIGYGLLYRDLRVRQEGLDVLQGVQLLTQQQMAN
jgi:hypothetical protein